MDKQIKKSEQIQKLLEKHQKELAKLVGENFVQLTLIDNEDEEKRKTLMTVGSPDISLTDFAVGIINLIYHTSAQAKLREIRGAAQSLLDKKPNKK